MGLIQCLVFRIRPHRSSVCLRMCGSGLLSYNSCSSPFEVLFKLFKKSLYLKADRVTLYILIPEHRLANLVVLFDLYPSLY